MPTEEVICLRVFPFNQGSRLSSLLGRAIAGRCRIARDVAPIVHTLEPRAVPWSVFLLLDISLSVGLLFGVYPARKAARRDPIEGLRHE